MLCVGLDPDPARFPAAAATARPTRSTRFCTAIVDATADLVCAFKPQIAHFAAQRAELQLEAVCRHIREHHPDVVLVLDAKRGDIGSTAEHYAEEAFGRYGADAVTVNPYLGTDAATPFLERGGVLALCRTSNPGSGELQDLDVGGAPLYERVATMVAERWSQIGDCGLVVGATYPEQLADVRRHRRRPADPAARRRRPGRRRRRPRSGPARPAPAPACSSARRARSCTPPPATTSPTPPAPWPCGPATPSAPPIRL